MFKARETWLPRRRQSEASGAIGTRREIIGALEEHLNAAYGHYAKYPALQQAGLDKKVLH